MIYLLCGPTKDRPPPQGPFPKPSSDQIETFYARLGMAVAAWQFVESQMVPIYAAAIGSPNSEAVRASFYTPVNFKTRLDLTHEAVSRSNLSDTDLLEWKRLYAKLSRKSRQRNKLAHANVMFAPAVQNRGRQLFMCPDVMDPTRFDPTFQQKAIITQTNLSQMRDAFESLRCQLFAFWERQRAAKRKPALPR